LIGASPISGSQFKTAAELQQDIPSLTSGDQDTVVPRSLDLPVVSEQVGRIIG
jgi:hypothetical protein